jgi:acylphosphatase
MITRRLRIKGRVQGVGYRYALRQEAERLGITGWVRNRADGSVEALVHGEAQAVEAVIAWARMGPPAAQVRDIAISPAEAEEDRAHAGFDLRPTV